MAEAMDDLQEGMARVNDVHEVGLARMWELDNW
jgi:hypothetical protein